MAQAPITKAQSTAIVKTTAEMDFEQKRMQDVLLLLENMTLREEATIKLILDCLYDVGSINYLNRKVPQPSLNRLMRYIARFSKPVFRVVAWRWFTKNCPQLITNWLYRKVSF